MVLYSSDLTNTGFSFILLTVNLFCHNTLLMQFGACILFLYIVTFADELIEASYKSYSCLICYV